MPLEVGTRGTMGSLVKREIDYYRKVELERAETSSRERPSRWGGFRFSMSNWKRKKRRSSGICSVVEVAHGDRVNDIPGYGYLNLKVDSQRYDV